MKMNSPLCVWRATPGQGRSVSSAGSVKPGYTSTPQTEVNFTLATTVTRNDSIDVDKSLSPPLPLSQREYCPHFDFRFKLFLKMCVLPIKSFFLDHSLMASPLFFSCSVK